MIQIYYGFGKGKTTAAIGQGMRAKGAGNTVTLVQFLKDDKSSELSVLPFDIFNHPILCRLIRVKNIRRGLTVRLTI